MLDWVKGYFLSGEITGKKITGGELNRLQRTAEKDGKKKFEIDEYKTDIQFKSLLSRLTALYKNDKEVFLNVELPAGDDTTIDTTDDTTPTDEDVYCNFTDMATDLDGDAADDLKVAITFLSLIKRIIIGCLGTLAK